MKIDKESRDIEVTTIVKRDIYTLELEEDDLVALGMLSFSAEAALQGKTFLKTLPKNIRERVYNEADGNKHSYSSGSTYNLDKLKHLGVIDFPNDGFLTIDVWW